MYSSSAAGVKNELRVAVVVNNHLRQATFKRRSLGDTFVFDIGGSLYTNVVSICHNTFKEVLLVPDGGEIPTDKVDATLTPTLTSATWTGDGSIISPSFVSIRLRWTLRDKSDSELWTAAVSGTASSREGSGKPEKMLARAVHDLVTKSYDQIARAEITRPANR